MNLYIYNHWFQENAYDVGSWSVPLKPLTADSPRVAWNHANGCWALYRILGGDTR